jgi:hypothetical protein
MASKKKSPRAFVGATTARVETMRAEALAMLLAGKSCPQIGEALGVTRERAWQVTKEALELLIAETMDKAEQWRAVLSQKWMDQLVKGEKLRDNALATGEAAPAEGKEGPALPLDALDTANGMIEKALAELGKLWGAYAAVKTEAKTASTVDHTTGGKPLPSANAAALAAMSTDQLAALEAALKLTSKQEDDLA